MRLLKGLLTCVFWLLIIALMVTPLGLIFEISQAEMELYQTPEAPVLQEVSIGEVVQVSKADVAEYITVSGSFTSETYVYQELDYENPSQIRWYVSTGSEVKEGQAIGQYQGAEVIAEATGIITALNAHGSDAYIRYRLFTPVQLQCRVNDRALSVLKRSKTMTTEAGEAVTLVFASNQKNSDGTTTVCLSIESEEYTFGQTVSELRILTGRVFYGTMVLPADCVYQKNSGENAPWYVRQVTAKGIFICEIEVEIGYSTGTKVCVSGLAEGTYYDSGYKAVVGG